MSWEKLKSSAANNSANLSGHALQWAALIFIKAFIVVYLEPKALNKAVALLAIFLIISVSSFVVVMFIFLSSLSLGLWLHKEYNRIFVVCQVPCFTSGMLTLFCSIEIKGLAIYVTFEDR